MVKYRRKMGKPIEAVQWRPGVEHPGVIKNGNGFAVMTIHGQLAYLAEGDWVLPELRGDEPDGKHFYPCKPDIFAKTYEPAQPPIVAEEGSVTEDMMRAPGHIVHITGVVNSRKPCSACGRSVADPCYTVEQVAKCELPPEISWAKENLPTPTTIEQAILERNEWCDTAAMHLRNEEFYCGIVTKIGEMFGEAARTSDDGSMQDSVLALKVPDLVRAELALIEALQADNGRLNIEIERVTRHQQGPLMGKD